MVTQSGNGSLNTKDDSMNPVTKLLTEAKALIEDESSWTQKTYARNKKGDAVDYLSDAATCFCTLGALHKAGENGSDFAEKKVLEIMLAIISEGGFQYISRFNDAEGRNHEDVLELFDKAIKMTQGEVL